MMQRARSRLAVVAVAIGTLAASGCAPSLRTAPNTDGGLSLSPTGDEVYRCMVDKGWDPVLTWDGGIDVSSDTMSKEQIPAFDADAAACWAPIEARVASMTEDEVRKAFAAEIDTRECLIDRGVQVDTPPSAQVYLDTFFDDRWTAYGAASLGAAQQDDAGWRELNEDCPQPSWSFGAQ